MLRMGSRGRGRDTAYSVPPPHRSGRADFLHPALASGGGVQTARWIRVIDANRRKPAADESFHSLPLDATMLASPAQSAMPEVRHRVTKVGQSVPVARHSEVSEMPAHNGLQPFADFRNRIMHTPPQLVLDPQQLYDRYGNRWQQTVTAGSGPSSSVS